VNGRYKFVPLDDSGYDTDHDRTSTIAALDALLCGDAGPAVPVIVQVQGSHGPRGHYVLVYGKNQQGQYEIVDPGNRMNTLLDANQGSFALRGFVTDPPDPSALVVQSDSNADVLVIDPNGLQTGFDANTGTLVNTIPQSAHDTDQIDADDGSSGTIGPSYSVQVEQPQQGIYKVLGVGKNAGPYTVRIFVIAQDGSIEPPIVINGTTSPGLVSTFEILLASTPGSISSLINGVTVLDPSGQNALQMSGGATLKLPTGLVAVNSSSSSALNISGRNSGITATMIDVTGNYIATGGSAANLHPTPLTGVAPTPDPMAGLPEPSTSGLPVFPGGVIPNGMTLQPGVYQNQVTVQGVAVVHFGPGLYILKNGINVSSSTIQGDGVTLYNQGTMTVSGRSMVKLTPPASGTYAGITVFQARGDSKTATLSGGSGSLLGGTFYLPNAQLTLSGGSNMKLGSLVAWRLSISGGAFSSQ
jgi:hypothetical protein